jgi:hypothetical protein
VSPCHARGEYEHADDEARGGGVDRGQREHGEREGGDGGREGDQPVHADGSDGPGARGVTLKGSGFRA